MIGSLNVYRLNRRCFVMGLALLMVAGGLCACASVPSESTKENRTCDAWADAAVTSEQWPQALERHQQLLGKEPSNCLAMYHLGFILGRMEDHSKEITWYNNAIACGYVKSDTLFFNLGMAYADERRMDDAIAAFKRAVRLNPGKADNHFGLGMTARTTGDTVAAERSLKQAIAISSHHWDARILLAKIYLDQGRLSSAGRHLEFVLERVPQNEEANNLYQLYKERQMTSYDR